MNTAATARRYYTVTYRDENCMTFSMMAESLEALSSRLTELEYCGSQLRAYDRTGSLVGYVNANNSWRYL